MHIRFGPISNREQFDVQVELRDQDGVLLSEAYLETATIIVSLRRLGGSSMGIIQTLQTSDDTVEIVAPGIFSFTFSESQMGDLDIPRVHEIGCTMEIGGVKRQLFTGTVAVTDGVVP